MIDIRPPPPAPLPRISRTKSALDATVVRESLMDPRSRAKVRTLPSHSRNRHARNESPPTVVHILCAGRTQALNSPLPLCGPTTLPVEATVTMVTLLVLALRKLPPVHALVLVLVM